MAAEHKLNARSIWMAWKDISFAIGDKEILIGMSGVLTPGHLCGVVGPSGCGKSTLLNILSGRQRSKKRNYDMEGEITVNGKVVNPVKFRTNVAYVMQDDALLFTETPRECLAFSSKLRLPSTVSNEEVDDAVDRMIETLHLEECESTIVGNELVKGISGGERKRTAVGVELITCPRILFLDEPLSGLDSYNAWTLVRSLKSLAEAGVGVVMTLHQPSSEIFHMLDDIVVLHQGEVVYFGPRSSFRDYFTNMGYPCPPKYNPLDHVMLVIQTEPDDKVEQLKASWLSSSLHKALRAQIYALRRKHERGESDLSDSSSDDFPLLPDVDGSDEEDWPGRDEHRANCCKQLCLLTMREFRHLCRDAMSTWATLSMFIFIALMYGWLFFQAGRKEESESTAPNCSDDSFDAVECATRFRNHYTILTVLAFLLMNLLSMAMIKEIPSQRPVFLREYAAKTYSSFSYLLAKTLLEIPKVFMFCTVVYLVSYFLVGLRGNLFLLIVFTWLLCLGVGSMTYCIAAACKSREIAEPLGIIPVIPQVLFAGIFIPVSQVPVSLQWLKYICPLYWAGKALSITEFQYVKDDIEACQSLNVTSWELACPGEATKMSLLEQNGIDLWGSPWIDALILILLFVVFRLLSYFLLIWRGRYVFG